MKNRFKHSPAQNVSRPIPHASRLTPHAPRSHAPRPYPLLKTLEDVTALAEKEHDLFHHHAFAIQCWLALLLQDAVAEYTDKKNPRDRSLQTGQAWCAFQRITEGLYEATLAEFRANLHRFTTYDHPFVRNLSQAIFAATLEESGTSFQPVSDSGAGFQPASPSGVGFQPAHPPSSPPSSIIHHP